MISRRWLRVTGQDGRDVTQDVLRGYYRVGRLDPVGPVAWEGVDGWETGA